MARYRRIDIRIWGDEKFRELSQPHPNGQSLFFYLLTGPHTGPVPGLANVGEAGLAEALGWPLPAFRKAMQELIDLDLVRFDRKARLLWIRNAIHYNPPASANVVRSWRATWDEAPECDLKKAVCAVLRQAICGMGEGFARAFQEAFGEGSAGPCLKPSANQEQERQEQERQEQERQEQDTPHPPGGAGAALGDDQQFLEFWRIYPKKAAKEDARRAWRKLAPADELVRTILAAVERQKNSAAWQKDNGQYVPHAATWLRGRRWDDQVSTAGPAGSKNHGRQYRYDPTTDPYAPDRCKPLDGQGNVPAVEVGG
jgi:hypothetical protein